VCEQFHVRRERKKRREKRDRNGRIGRMLMYLHLMKNGYPVLVLPTSMSNMFNHGDEMRHGEFVNLHALTGGGRFPQPADI